MPLKLQLFVYFKIEFYLLEHNLQNIVQTHASLLLFLVLFSFIPPGKNGYIFPTACPVGKLIRAFPC